MHERLKAPKEGHTRHYWKTFKTDITNGNVIHLRIQIVLYKFLFSL